MRSLLSVCVSQVRRPLRGPSHLLTPTSYREPWFLSRATSNSLLHDDALTVSGPYINWSVPESLCLRSGRHRTYRPYIMASTVIFITGANRGLGLALLQKYLVQPNHIVIAGNRNPTHPSSQALADLPKGEGSKLIVVKLDALIDQDAFVAVESLQKDHGVDHIDIVIANAGVSHAWPPVAELKLEDLRGHLTPNVYGMITLYQATRPLLHRSLREPIFTPIGSSAGCIACVFSCPFTIFEIHQARPNREQQSAANSKCGLRSHQSSCKLVHSAYQQRGRLAERLCNEAVVQWYG
jgi:hypothetical protein